ncbi:MAG: hypothetical protein FWD73_10090 [Polyangiaceae bacterium]|nr:hypothetical protein [Polyangiaceae bacterium]
MGLESTAARLHASDRRCIGSRNIAVGGFAAICTFFGMGTMQSARAQGVPTAEVLVIHGTQCEKPSVDPAIGEMPPLRYNCYKLLEKKRLPLSRGQASSMALPNGRTFQLTLHEVTSQKHYKVGAAISQPNGKGFLKLADITAEPNKRFNVGGWAHEKGTILLGIRILP